MGSYEESERRDVQAVPDGGTDPTRPSCDLAFGCGESRFLIVDAAGAGIGASLAPFLSSGAWLAIEDTSPPDVRYAVETWQPSWGARGAGYRISRDGKVRYLGRSVDRLLQWLRADVDEQASRRPRHGVRIQASAVIWREQAILIPGRCRTGTSSLVAELVRHGATHYADDLAVLDNGGGAHPNGQRPGSPTPAVAMIVSTTYRPELTWQPQVLRGTRAVLPVIESALPERNETRHLLRLAARLAPTVVTLQGPRSEASIAAPLILAALDELLDRGAPADAVASKTRRLISRARDVLATQRIADGAV